MEIKKDANHHTTTRRVPGVDRNIICPQSRSGSSIIIHDDAWKQTEPPLSAAHGGHGGHGGHAQPITTKLICVAVPEAGECDVRLLSPVEVGLALYD